MTPISPNHQPRGLTLPPITTLLALTITGITLLTLLTISLTLLYQRHTLLYQRHTLHLRRAREETLGRVAISNSQTGPIHGDPRESARATEPARDERDARAESTVEVNGGIWPPKDAERVESNSGEAGEERDGRDGGCAIWSWERREGIPRCKSSGRRGRERGSRKDISHLKDYFIQEEHENV